MVDALEEDLIWPAHGVEGRLHAGEEGVFILLREGFVKDDDQLRMVNAGKAFTRWVSSLVRQ